MNTAFRRFCGFALALLALGLSHPSQAQAQCGAAVLANTLRAVGGFDNHWFGTSVDVSASTMVVGAPLNIVSGRVQGVVHVYERTDLSASWRYVTTLIAPDGADGDRFGFAVSTGTVYNEAAARYDSFIAVGAPNAIVAGAANPNRGAVYVYQHIAGVWTHTEKFFRTDTSRPLLDYGYSVALGRADTGHPDYVAFPVLVAGSPSSVSECEGYTAGGQLRVYRFTGSDWISYPIMGGCPGDRRHARLGAAIEFLDVGGAFLVGAPGYNDFPSSDQPSSPGAGAVFHYRQEFTTDANFSQRIRYDALMAGQAEFGSSIAINYSSDLTFVVGAPGFGSNRGAVGVIRFSSGVRTVLAPRESVAGDRFGHAVATTGGTVFVGTPGYGAQDKGAVHVFNRRSGLDVWDETPTPITELDASPDGLLGWDLELESSPIPEWDLLVGAPGSNFGNGIRSGAVIGYAPFTNSEARQVYTEPRLRTNDNMGSSCAIFGDTAVVGAADEDTPAGEDAGAVYVYTRGSAGWEFSQRLVSSNQAAFDYFGGRVAIDGNTIAIGATGDNNANGSNAGAVYVFARNNSTSLFVERTILTANDGAANDRLGSSVAVRGTWILSGASEDDGAGGADQGSVYAFQSSNGTWAQNGKMVASDGAAGDLFGSAVALALVPTSPFNSDLIALIGAYGDDNAAGTNAGAFYAFRLEAIIGGVAWTQRSKMGNPDAGVNTSDNFGFSIAMSGASAIVGCPIDDQAALDAGAAYVYIPGSAGTWTAQGKLMATQPTTGSRFGYSVAIEGANAVVGSPLETVSGLVQGGRAYLFQRTGTTWAQADDFLSPVIRTAGDRFALGLGLSGTSAIVGAPLGDAAFGDNAGYACVFDFNLVPPTITGQPQDAAGCRNALTIFEVGASGAGPFLFRWQYLNAASVWTNVASTLPNGSSVLGSQSRRMAITGARPGTTRLRCIVSNACGGVISNEVTLTSCWADLDGGAGTGNCDAAVTIDDLIYFLFAFEQGDLAADLDDGSRSGTPDSGVTIEDLIFFLIHFEAGC